MYNSEFIKEYCVLVNKLLVFIQNYFEGIVPAGRVDHDLFWEIKSLYEKEEELLNAGESSAAQEVLEEVLSAADAYFEQGNPWESFEADRRACRNTVYNTLQMVANLTVILAGTPEELTDKEAEYPVDAAECPEDMAGCPAEKVMEWLELSADWEVQIIRSGYELPDEEVLDLL